MTQTLRLSGEVYRKLAQGAAERGMTIESLLTVFSDLVVLPGQPTEADRRRSRRIENLLERALAGELSTADRGELDELIDVDYQVANARADELIRGKHRRPGNGHPTGRKRVRK